MKMSILAGETGENPQIFSASFWGPLFFSLRAPRNRGNVAVIFLGGCMVGLQNFSWTKLTVLGVAPGRMRWPFGGGWNHGTLW